MIPLLLETFRDGFTGKTVGRMTGYFVQYKAPDGSVVHITDTDPTTVWKEVPADAEVVKFGPCDLWRYVP